jgi:hypothetical protein
VAKVWHAPPESAGEAPPHENSKQKELQLQQAGRVAYWRKQKGQASRRTLNKQSLLG